MIERILLQKEKNITSFYFTQSTMRSIFFDFYQCMYQENFGNKNVYYVVAWGMRRKESQFAHNCTSRWSVTVNPERKWKINSWR